MPEEKALTLPDYSKAPRGRLAAADKQYQIGCQRCTTARRTAYAIAINLCGNCTTNAGSLVPTLFDGGWDAITHELARYLVEKIPHAPFIALIFDGFNRDDRVPWQTKALLEARKGPSVHSTALGRDITNGQVYIAPAYLRALLDVGTLVRRVKPALPRPLVWPSVISRAVDDEEFLHPVDTLIKLAWAGGGSTGDPVADLLPKNRDDALVEQVGRPVRDYVAEAFPELCGDPPVKKPRARTT